MGEIRIVVPSETRGFSHLVWKKRIVGPGETRISLSGMQEKLVSHKCPQLESSYTVTCNAILCTC